MKACTLLIIVGLTLGEFVVQERFFAPVPYCDRFTQITITTDHVNTIKCTRNMVIDTRVTCSPTSVITSNTEGYAVGTYHACQSPYRTAPTPDT